MHEWSAGVLNASSWHGLETIGVMPHAAAMIRAGERSGAWPIALERERMRTEGGFPVPGRRAIVGLYWSGERRVVGDVSTDYRNTTPDAWRGLIEAACLAGAKPTGAFALRDHTRVVATFDVGGNGIRTKLIFADAFDTSMALTVGTTSVRVVCANTLAMSMRGDGAGMAKIRHTASLETRVNALKATIGDAIATGEKVRTLYQRATDTKLNRAQAAQVFDALFPEAPEDAPQATKTRVANVRAEAQRAAGRPENSEGGSLATLWNAATWMVDRQADGSPRMTRGGDNRLESMLMGARAKRVEDIQSVIEVILRDGTVQPMALHEALESKAIDGERILADILDAGDAE